MNNIPTSFRSAIIHKYPNAKNLRFPPISGSKRNVIFANINNKVCVFKFGEQDIINKNAKISKIYLDAGIPVPKITVGQFQNIFFEEYEQLPGTTLFEAVKNGITANKIRQIYREILDNFAKMCEIAPQTLENTPFQHIHCVTKSDVTNVNNATLGKICMALVYIMNSGTNADNAVFHSDITPKNTVVSSDGHLVGFLDTDSIAVSNINYAFGAMATKYQQLGFEITELFDYFEKISNKKINRTRIKTMANANNFGKKVLWHHSQTKQK